MKKISVISGGASGLGLELATQLAGNGHDVVLLSRDEAKLKSAADKIRFTAPDITVHTFACNIGKEQDVKRLGEYLAGRDLTVEYLFNNAGMGLFAGAETTTPEMIDRVFEANLKGMILLTTEILRITPKEEELTIVNIMSTSAQIGRAMETIYCAAKFGARGYTEALRSEYKGTRRNIIAVYPGGMRTDFWKNIEAGKDLSGFMDPAVVASKIVNAVLLADKTVVSDITILRR